MSGVTPQMDSDGDVLTSRFAAQIVDGIVAFLVLVVSIVVAVAVGSQLPQQIGEAVIGIGILVGLFGPFVYRVYAEANHGQTIGKRTVGIVVVTPDGESVGYVGSIVRNLLRIADALPFFYLLGAVCIGVTGGKRLGDLAAGTVVVETE